MEKTKIDKNQKLWSKATKLIPGGNQMLSKRPDMFLPNRWPTYFKKSKDVFIWDLNNRKYIDMSFMGVGTNILGYSNKEINKEVLKKANDGNLTTLNCPEEVLLAEKLISMHPWSDMARFARSGGEANAIAVRIARAAAKSEKIAVCGYHGWHDWYLAANISKKDSIKDMLLPGLDSKGVPKNLKDSIVTFEYGDIKNFKKIINKYKIGIVKMEFSRNYKPDLEFLRAIRKITKEKKIILIFDECTSGFREIFGGLHLKYKIYPDMAMFGKALGNGYAITAVLGKKNIMENAQSTFISSTFWTERIGYVAALKTLELMKKEKSWDIITNTGNEIKERWKQIANKNDLEIKLTGLASLCSFVFNSKNHLKYKTFITQEMLKKNILATTSVYVSIKHNKKVLEKYFKELEIIFKKISKCEKGILNINKLLESPVCTSTFKRLN